MPWGCFSTTGPVGAFLKRQQHPARWPENKVPGLGVRATHSKANVATPTESRDSQNVRTRSVDPKRGARPRCRVRAWSRDDYRTMRVKEMGLDWDQTPFNIELPLPPAAYKERVGGNGVQLEKKQNKIKKVEALGFQRHPQI